jgi:hypothetical protein
MSVVAMALMSASSPPSTTTPPAAAAPYRPLYDVGAGAVRLPVAAPGLASGATPDRPTANAAAAGNAAAAISLQPTGAGHLASGMDTRGILRGPDKPHLRRSTLPDRSPDQGNGHERYPPWTRPQKNLTPAVIPSQTTVPGSLDSGGAASGIRRELPVLPGSLIGIRPGSGQFTSSLHDDVAPSPTPTLIPLHSTTDLSPSATPGSLNLPEGACGIHREPSTSIPPLGDSPFSIGIQPEGTPEVPLPASASSPSPSLSSATLPAFQHPGQLCCSDWSETPVGTPVQAVAPGLRRRYQIVHKSQLYTKKGLVTRKRG